MEVTNRDTSTGMNLLNYRDVNGNRSSEESGGKIAIR